MRLYVARSVCVALQIAYTPVYTYIYFIFYFIHTLCFLFGEKVQQLFVSVCLYVCLFFVAHLARLQIKSCSKRNFIFSTAVELTFKLVCVCVCVGCICVYATAWQMIKCTRESSEQQREREGEEADRWNMKDKQRQVPLCLRFYLASPSTPTQRQLNFKFLC